jgi:general secretion pathway protein D
MRIGAWFSRSTGIVAFTIVVGGLASGGAGAAQGLAEDGVGGSGRSGRRGGLARGARGRTPGAAGQDESGQARGVSLPGGVQSSVPGAASGPRPVFKEDVRIVADEVTNSLVILATKRDYQLIIDVLNRIDVVPRQVVLEVMIAEVVLSKDLELGVSYALAEGKLSKLGSGSSSSSSGTPDLLTRAGNAVGGGLLGDAVRFPTSGGFAIISPTDNVQIFLNALQGLTDVKMLSAPHIIAADNRESHILVGQSIPILTSSSQSTASSSSQVVNQVQYRDTGKILTVLPQVNSQGLVNLQIRQEVSAVLETASGTVTSFGNTNSPAFSTREAETTAVVQDGETLIIGGIMDDSISHSRSGIPYLMDVPVIGAAFRSDSDKLERTELLITITPSVIRSKDEARRVTDDYIDRVGGLAGLRRAMDARRHRHVRRETPEAPRDDESAPPERPLK